MSRHRRVRGMSSEELYDELVETVVAILTTQDLDHAIRMHRRLDRINQTLWLRGEIPRRGNGCTCEECFVGFEP